MKEKVIFKISVENRYGKFALASNFIYKMENSPQNISLEEVQGISTGKFQQELQENERKYRDLSRWVIDNDTFYKEIRHPEKLHIPMKKIYCLAAKESNINDVTELQYFVLIKKYFRHLPIFLLLSGSDSFYHTVSHYLYSVGNIDEEFYNCIIFKDDKNNVKRLQLNNIGALKGFYPLQFVDQESVKLFTKTVSEILREEDFEQMFTKKYTDIFAKVPLELRGGISLWYSCRMLFSKEIITELYKVLKCSNILTFLMMSYSLKYMGISDGEIKDWIGHLNQVQEYAMGVYQLAENVIQHSDTGIGILSIKTYKPQTTYLSQRYGDKIHKQLPYLEIAIVDYSATNKKGNIADTFKSRLNLEEKRLFNDIQPVDFFYERHEDTSNRGREIQIVFDEFHNKEENIGKHFGLQIFKNVVYKNKGIFACYSHGSHIWKEGEEYGLYTGAGNSNKLQMPGTGYIILLPLGGGAWEIKRSDTNIETFIDTEKRADVYITQFAYAQKILEIEEIEIKTRLDKQNVIENLIKQLNDNYKRHTEHIVYYINCSGIKGEYGEYICKALLRSELHYVMPDYVFYECGESFVELFRKSMSIYFQRNTTISLAKNDYTIVLYTTGRMQETIICPNNYEKTYLLNKMSSFSRDQL